MQIRMVVTTSRASASRPGTRPSTRRRRRLASVMVPTVTAVPSGVRTTSSPTSSRPRAAQRAALRRSPREAVDRWVAPGPGRRGRLDDLGALAGTAAVRQWADQADRVTPVLRTDAPTGERVDEVEFHPAYHRADAVAVGDGPHREPWTRPADSSAHARRAAGFVMWSRSSPATSAGVDDVCRRAGPRGRARRGGALAAGLASRATTRAARRRPARPGSPSAWA